MVERKQSDGLAFGGYMEAIGYMVDRMMTEIRQW